MQVEQFKIACDGSAAVVLAHHPVDALPRFQFHKEHSVVAHIFIDNLLAAHTLKGIVIYHKYAF